VLRIFYKHPEKMIFNKQKPYYEAFGKVYKVYPSTLEV